MSTKKTYNRRAFLKTLGLSAGALGLAGASFRYVPGLLVEKETTCRHCSALVAREAVSQIESGLLTRCPGCGVVWNATKHRGNSIWRTQYKLRKLKSNETRFRQEMLRVYFPNPALVEKSDKPLATLKQFNF